MFYLSFIFILEVVMNETINLPDAKKNQNKSTEKLQVEKPAKKSTSVDNLKESSQIKHKKLEDQEKTSNKISKSVPKKAANLEAKEEDAKETKADKTATKVMPTKNKTNTKAEKPSTKASEDTKKAKEEAKPNIDAEENKQKKPLSKK